MNRDMGEAATIEATGRPSRERGWSHWLMLGVLLLVAAWLRFGAAVFSVFDPPVNGDSVQYISEAYNLKHYGVFSSEDTWRQPASATPAPDAMRPPGYAILLSWLLEDRPDYDFLRRVHMLQVFLGTLIVAAGYLLARRVLSPEWGLAVTLLMALCPQLITLGTSVLTETAYTLVLTIFFHSLVSAAQRPGARGFAIAGALLGLSVLIRFTLLYLPLVLLPAMLWLLPRPVRWRCACALLLGFGLVYGPWLLRNELVLGRASDPKLAVEAIVDGSYPDQMYQGRPETLGFAHRFDHADDDIVTVGQALDFVGADFRAHPADMLRWYLLGKPIAFYEWRFIEGSGDVFIKTAKRTPYRTRFEFIWSHELMRWLHWPLIALNGLGIVVAMLIAVRRRGHPEGRVWGLFVVVMVFTIAIHVIGYPLGRYSVPFRALTWSFAFLPLELARRRWLPVQTK